MQKRWSKAEIAHLKRHAASSGPEELANKLNTDTETVLRKLEELGLTPEGQKRSELDEEAITLYGKALELMHTGKYAPAAKSLEKVAADADERQLADRARQHLAVCRQHLEKEDGDADPYLRAVYEKNRGNVEDALELCRAHGNEKEDERYAYLLASLHSLSGDTDKALEHLDTAIRLEPKNRVHAYHDPDFEELRGQEEFKSLVPGSSGS